MSFARTRESNSVAAICWMPAFAGMTSSMCGAAWIEIRRTSHPLCEFTTLLDAHVLVDEAGQARRGAAFERRHRLSSRAHCESLANTLEVRSWPTNSVKPTAGEPSLRPRRPSIRPPFAARPGSKRGASGRGARHDRRLRRRLWHDHLWRLRVVHERKHHPDRLSGRGGRVRPRFALGAGDPVLRRRIVRRDLLVESAGRHARRVVYWRGRSRARRDRRLDAISASLSGGRSRSRRSASRWAS